MAVAVDYPVLDVTQVYLPVIVAAWKVFMCFTNITSWPLLPSLGEA